MCQTSSISNTSNFSPVHHSDEFSIGQWLPSLAVGDSKHTSKRFGEMKGRWWIEGSRRKAVTNDDCPGPSYYDISMCAIAANSGG